MFECPDYLNEIKAYNISPGYLYSYWLTIHFLIYAPLFILFPKYVPSWMNPYPTILIGLFGQMAIFIMGSNSMPIYFLVGVGLWKLILMIGTFALLPADWSGATLAFNIGIIVIYWLYMRYIGIDPIDLYACIVNKRAYYPSTVWDFLKIRFS